MSKAIVMKYAAGSILTLAAAVGTGVQKHVPQEPSELVQYQIKCMQAQAFLVQWVFSSTNGRMAFTAGEAHRPEITAKAYARMGIGISASLHTQRLAWDHMLILDGKYSPRTEDYEYAGKAWEDLGPKFGVKTAWGGRFKNADGNHFSCSWEGRS
ncbi:MAG: hypothetical protein ACRCV9_07105 [Burkholderiaceae bacterium]